MGDVMHTNLDAPPSLLDTSWEIHYRSGGKGLARRRQIPAVAPSSGVVAPGGRADGSVAAHRGRD